MSAGSSIKYVTDKALIKWFKDNYKQINFINESKEYPTVATYIKFDNEELINKLDEAGELHKSPNADLIMDLWKNLLGDAIIFLKSNDEREKYHDGEIFGTDDLHDILKQFRKFERMLYGATDYYRDHIAHVFRVFILGEYLIKENIEFKNICVYDDKLPENKRISPGEKEAMWCIISLTHDLGYALETIDKINERVREMVKKYGKASVQELTYLFPPQTQSIDNFVIKFISSDLIKLKEKLKEDIQEKDDKHENKDPKGKNVKVNYSTHLQSKYFLKFSRAYEKFDHGIISCTVLMRNLVFFLESDFLLDQNKLLNVKDAKQFLIRQNILRSIASHNCEDIYHLKGRNFPFLLLICDEFQEWGRPRMEEVFKESVPKTGVWINKFGHSDTIDMDIEYKVSFTSGGLVEDEKQKIKKEILNYFVRKTKKFIKVLRSAVGDERGINLTFIVTDISNTNYYFSLKQPASGLHLEPKLKRDWKDVKLKCLLDEIENDNR